MDLAVGELGRLVALVEQGGFARGQLVVQEEGWVLDVLDPAVVWAALDDEDGEVGVGLG